MSNSPPKFSPEEAVAWEAFCAGVPDYVAAVARKYPCDRCYRSTENPGFHYWIYSYEENADWVCTLKLIHGLDSTLPGTYTFGQPPDQLLPCDCGKWEMPSKEICDAVAASARAEGDRMRAKNKRRN